MIRLPCVPPTRRALSLLLGSLCALALPGGAAAQKDGGKFEGAVWKFEMTPMRGKEEPRRGQFRVAGLKLYQKERRDSPGFDKEAGHKEILADKRTRLVFHDLRANGGKVTGIRGHAVVTFDKFGEWSGRYVDADGSHWHFKCSRVQE
jgi:hypothetical protein